MTFLVTAEHTHGGSTSHPCVDGVYSDPADTFELEVEAESEAAAIESARSDFSRDVEACKPCKCQRRLCPGSGAWWNSVELVAGESQGASASDS